MITTNIRYDAGDATLRFAARELQYYMERMWPSLEVRLEGDAPVSISLQIEETLAGEGLDPVLDDVIRIEIASLSGIIAGSNSRAVLLGVYQYAYRLGCRFLRPGREYEYLPALDCPDAFNVTLTHKAALRHRGVCIEGADSEENILQFIDWLPKIGCNSFFVQFQIPYTFLDRWYRHINNPLVEAESFTMDRALEITERMEDEIRKRNLLHHGVGHGWTSRVMGQPDLGWNTSGELAPDEAYAEYPALINGKRGFFHGIPGNTNLCYSNPEVTGRFTTCVADYAFKHRYVRYLHVWLADDYNNQCECEECRKKLPTDYYIRLLNEIDRELTCRGLDTKIVMLIYMDLLWAPKTESLRNPERFVLMFAPISRTFNHSYQESRVSADLPEYQRNQIQLPTGLEENLAYLQEWQKRFQGDSFVYDYHLGRAHYGDPGYLHISRLLYQDIRYLKELRLNGYISCQELRAFLPNALPDYVMGLALFDETISFDEIAQDYYRHAYGSGGKAILEYLDTLSSFYNCDYFNKKGERADSREAGHMREALDFLSERKPWLDRECLSGEDENDTEAVTPINQFMSHLNYHWKYSRLLTEALLSLASGEAGSVTEEKWNGFKEYIRSCELCYQGALDVYRVIEVGTNYTGFPADN